MSQENVEVARRMHDCWNARDLESMLALADPEIEYVNSPTAVEPGTRRGHDGLEAVVRAQWEFLSDAHFEIQRIYDRGEEIIVLGNLSRRMPGSDHRVETQGLFSWTVQNETVIRGALLGVGPAEIRGALQAAGLSEAEK
jgi:ketosteroid isomerase-like protein